MTDTSRSDWFWKEHLALPGDEANYHLNLHGASVQIRCGLPHLGDAIAQQFKQFIQREITKSSPITGFIGPYDPAQVLRHVSHNAVPLTGIGFGRDAYQDGENIWMIDDHCGLCEINFIKGQWRSWIVPPALSDMRRCVDSAILWPMAQLLRIKGLHLIPAASVAINDFAALILCPFGILPELSAIAANGWRIIGQRWTCLRMTDGKIDLLHMPGGVETAVWPRRANTAVNPESFDLHAVYPESLQQMGTCNAVVVVSSGRRPQASANGLSRWEAGEVVRRAWPIAEVHPRKRGGMMAGELGRICQCVEARLSPRGEDILEILDAVRDGKIGHGSGRLTLFVNARQTAMAG